MTRVNVGIHPSELPREVLLSEHKEITRIPNAVKRNPKIAAKPIPEQFRLGEGHVRFFYNKLAYLRNRYLSLYAECVRRGYNVTNKESAFFGVPTPLDRDYTPTQRDREILLERFKEKGHRLLNYPR